VRPSARSTSSSMGARTPGLARTLTPRSNPLD
jgi:hypothetical protein